MSLFDGLFGKKLVSATTATTSNLLQRKRVDDPVDWSNSEIHLMLLSRFLEPKRADNVPAYWESELGEPPPAVVSRFIKLGLLVPASLKVTVEYCNTGPDLKKLLKERNLKVSGKKQELAERLVVADEAGMSRLHAEKAVIECSPEIRQLVSQYVANKKREFDDVITQTMAALRIKDFAKASRNIETYESKQLRLSEGCVQLASPKAEFVAPAPMLGLVMRV